MKQHIQKNEQINVLSRTMKEKWYTICSCSTQVACMEVLTDLLKEVVIAEVNKGFPIAALFH